jgi:hypothetical protein
MLSFLMFVFIFAVIAILLSLVAVGVFLSRIQKKTNTPKEDPNVIDLQAIDVDDEQVDEITSTDLLLKP